MRPLLLLLLAALTLAGCRPTTPPPPPHQEAVVDSVIPRDEALRRFRDGLPAVTILTGGATSREALLTAYARAVAARDTATLGRLALTRAEFGYLYYPTAAQGLPPYDLAPELYWFTLNARSAAGLKWVMENRSGVPLHVVAWDCGTGKTVEGENTLYGPCSARRVQAPGDTITERFISLIIERGGQWKVVAYSGGKD